MVEVFTEVERGGVSAMAPGRGSGSYSIQCGGNAKRSAPGKLEVHTRRSLNTLCSSGSLLIHLVMASLCVLFNPTGHHSTNSSCSANRLPVLAVMLISYHLLAWLNISVCQKLRAAYCRQIKFLHWFPPVSSNVLERPLWAAIIPIRGISLEKQIR